MSVSCTGEEIHPAPYEDPGLYRLSDSIAERIGGLRGNHCQPNRLQRGVQEHNSPQQYRDDEHDNSRR